MKHSNHKDMPKSHANMTTKEHEKAMYKMMEKKKKKGKK